MRYLERGAERIQEMIDAAAANGTGWLEVSGCYEMEKTVLLPSDFTLTLRNCHLRMAEGTFCNMFTNANCRTEAGRTREGADRNIRILGEGMAILDGGPYNGLSESNSLRDGRPHISVNSLLLFANVDGFRVSGLQVRDQRWWAMNFVGCRRGYIGSVDFRSDPAWTDEHGNLRSGGLTIRNYSGIRVKNSDGIDLRAGCHDIVIENITGYTEDDAVALTGLDDSLCRLYGWKGMDRAIYNVIVRSVNTASLCANVRLLPQDGVEMYNILVDGVMDASRENPYIERGETGVRLGDSHLYGKRHNTAAEVRNITIRNVFSRAGAVMRVAGAMSACAFENIRGFDGAGPVVDEAGVDTSPFWKN